VSSLRLKLTLWYLVVFGGIQLLLLCLVIVWRQESLEEGYHAAMGDAAGAMIENILIAEYDWSGEGVQSLVPTDLPLAFFVIRDVDGKPVASTPDLDLERVRFGKNELVSVGPTKARFSETDDPREGASDATDLVLITLPFKHPSGEFFLQAAVHSEQWRHVLVAFREQFLLGISIGLCAAWAAAWVISGRAVDPLRRISRAAQDVSIEKLGERISVDARDAEVRHLEGELNHALARIEAGYTARERFMEAVSHELNTPVAVLLTEAQTLKGAVLDAEETQAFVLSVEEEMRRLQTLVRSLLSLSKADFVQQSDEIRFDDVVENAVRHCTPLASGQSVNIMLSAPELNGSERELRGDRWLLETMIDNLLRNAVRVSPPEGVVEVAWKEEANVLTLGVRDYGPGIPDEYLQRVFDPFVQVPRDPERLGGTGLGLSIARRIAEVHDGSIDVRNHDRGCSFTVRLPLRTSPQPVG
jgi:signal transduction histidine kinase